VSERRIHFDPTIKLGDLVGAVLMLIGAGAAYATLKGDISTLAATDARHDKLIEQKVDREVLGRSELELSRRIVETQQSLTASTVSINEGFREVKGLLRDLDQKLDRKADKPGR
jgi:hypothetical protein